MVCVFRLVVRPDRRRSGSELEDRHSGGTVVTLASSPTYVPCVQGKVRAQGQFEQSRSRLARSVLSSPVGESFSPLAQKHSPQTHDPRSTTVYKPLHIGAKNDDR